MTLFGTGMLQGLKKIALFVIAAPCGVLAAIAFLEVFHQATGGAPARGQSLDILVVLGAGILAAILSAWASLKLFSDED